MLLPPAAVAAPQMLLLLSMFEMMMLLQQLSAAVCCKQAPSTVWRSVAAAGGPACYIEAFETSFGVCDEGPKPLWWGRRAPA